MSNAAINQHKQMAMGNYAKGGAVKPASKGKPMPFQKKGAKVC